MSDERQGLESLAQAHIVGEDPTKAVLPQKRQPPEPIELVAAQLGTHPGRHLGRGQLLKGTEPADRLPPLTRRDRLIGELGELIPDRHLVAADLRALGLPFAERFGLLQQFAQPVEGRVIEGEERVVDKLQMRLVLGQGGEQRSERNPLALDRDLEGEVEPVAVLGRLGCDPHLRGRGELGVVDALTADLDDDLGMILQPRQHPHRELRGIDSDQMLLIDGRCRRPDPPDLLEYRELEFRLSMVPAIVRDRKAAPGAVVLPRPCQQQSLLGFELDLHMQARVPELRQLCRGIVAGERGQTAQLGEELGEEHLGVVIGDAERRAGDEHLTERFGDWGGCFGQGQSEGVARQPVDEGDGIVPDAEHVFGYGAGEVDESGEGVAAGLAHDVDDDVGGFDRLLRSRGGGEGEWGM